MAQPPRDPAQPTVDGPMWRSVTLTGTVMAGATLATIDFFLPGGLLEGSGTLDEARTAGFTVLVFAQLFNCFNARSERLSAFRHMLANRWLLGAVMLSLALQVAVVHVPALNVAFGTTPLDVGQWAICLLMGSAVLWFSEVQKLVVRSPRTTS